MPEKTETVTVRISENLKRDIQAEAESFGMSEADYVRETLRASTGVDLTREELEHMVNTMEDISESMEELEQELNKPIWHVLRDRD